MRSAAVLTLLLSLVASRQSAAEGTGIHETYVHVGGQTVRALCTEGMRRVLLLHGENASAETWRSVLERLDGLVGACAYDRPGSGLSTPPPAARGWFELEDEMRRIHAALGFSRGYTLVGHALGGLYARLFAADRPTDVGALVLVEPAHEDMPAAARPGMPYAAWKEWTSRRRLPNSDGVKELEVAEHARSSHLPDVPVTVITATRRPRGNGWDEHFLNQAARRVHSSILQGITFGRQVPASHSGHEVQSDEPDLVAREILRVDRISKETRR